MEIRKIISHWGGNISSIIAPLVTLPFLIKKLGLEHYGELALIQLISITLLPIIDFGMSINGPKWVDAKSKEGNTNQITRVIIIFHTLIFIIAGLLTIIYIKFQNPSLIVYLILSLGSIFFTTIIPVYLIIGAKLQEYYGCITILTRVFIILGILNFVDESNGVLKFFIIQLVINILSFLIYIYLINKGEYELTTGDIKSDIYEIKKLISNGFQQFIRRSSFLPLNIVIPIILNDNWGASSVAVFSIGEKIKVVIWQIINPILSWFINRYYTLIGKDLKNKLTKEIIILLGLLSLIGCLFVYNLALQILEFLNIEPTLENIKIIQVCGLYFLSGTALAYSMTRYLPELSNNKLLTIIIFISSTLVLLSSMYILSIKGSLYAILLQIILEIIVFMEIIFYAKKYKR